MVCCDISKATTLMSLCTVGLISDALGITFLAACGSDGSSPSAIKLITQTIKAEACIDVETRETVLYVRNLNDFFEWTGTALRVAKDGKAYLLD